ncbi:DNA-binding protein [Lipomyces tetrasporus]|uniref:DNA-binding protein n=1 Tax=Lipomyces tetrasporus TaxID=54092 RepID=A0AAD7QR95_9ASCO|nr:DNA-binding protein [Lipomyces tetrasporus]KAJ8098312.1 DNA-binding protein [Lipomyces tetrasporus]
MSTSKAQLPSWTFAQLLSAYSDFLIVSIHTILYEREIYPHETFMLARKYNFPVRQSRHPQVCDWVRNAIGACMDQMRKGNVCKVSVVILSSIDIPLERFVFDVTSFPKVSLREQDVEMKNLTFNMTDMEEQFRTCIMKLSHVSSVLGKLPPECTFTVTIELNEEANAPVGHDSPWVPADDTTSKPGTPLKSVPPKVRPLRNVLMGPLSFDIWVEESKAKDKVVVR